MDTEHTNVSAPVVVRSDGSSPAPAPFIPAGMQRCPAGCGLLISRKIIACPADWARLPKSLKIDLHATTPSTFGRMRVVAEMRKWLRENPARPAGAGGTP